MGIIEAGKITVDSLRELRGRAARLALQVLVERRSTDGYENWIADLKNTTSTPQEKTQNYTDNSGCWKYNPQTDRVESKDFELEPATKKIKRGWSLELKNGRLNVAANHISADMMKFLDSKLEGKSWYETMSQKPAQINPPKFADGFPGFPQQYKGGLGYYNENPAMDVAGILIDKNGKLSVQVIKRLDGTFAFVGGMVFKHLPEHAQKLEVREKCYHETLEELFSGGMFTPDSPSSNAVAGFDPIQWNQALKDVFALDEFKKKREFSQMLPMANELQIIFENPGDFNSRMAQLQSNLMSRGLAKKIPEADLEIFWVQVKCRLYEKLLPAQYKLLTDFLDQNMKEMPKTINAADYRNTAEAWMATTPHYFLVKKAELLALKKGMLLESTGGDDALEALIVPLEDLYKTGMFSSHEEILLGMLEHIEQNNPGFLNQPAVMAQLMQAESNISAREKVNNNLQVLPATAYAPPLVLQTVDNGAPSSSSNNNNNVVVNEAEQVLPMPSTIAEFTQIKDQIASVEEDEELEPIALTESVRLANQKLLTKLGTSLYAELTNILEDARLPLSGRIVLAELSDCEEIEFLFDDSGSMGDPFNKGTTEDPFVFVDAGNGPFKKTRWYEAFERFELLVPLAALAGGKVKISLINGRTRLALPAGIKQENGAYCFDFSKKSASGTNDVASFQQELYLANQFLTVVKAAGPSGSTNATPHLKRIVSANSPNKKRFTVFITDGDTDNPDADKQILSNRSYPEQNPVVVVACTRQSERIQWVRDVGAQDRCVAMLDDFTAERKVIRNNHGTKVSYTPKIWLLSNLLMVKPKGQATQGLHLLHGALKENRELTEAELAEYLGYKNLPKGYYDLYKKDRNRFQVQTGVASASTANLSTSSYNAAGSSSASAPPVNPPPAYNTQGNASSSSSSSSSNPFSKLFGF